ncbi:MAG: phosphatase PAP2 family protein [Rhizobiales bacterium 65-79]|nr:phosphatase PAP2 family protein [Hyphomicrobiales bacterium]OJU04815.1 MAG: phosphatase PAP2 family protein [Rhizobiales bacterium 65-79]
MDAKITRWINSLAGAHPTLDTVMVAATQLGVPLMVFFVAAQWWSRNDRTHVRHVALVAGLSFLLGLAINQAILLVVHRIRPYDAGLTHLIIAPSTDWSFPSDHATASIAVLSAFAFQRLPCRAIALLGLAALICWSRVYVGTHYVTDVIGGAITGVIGAAVVRFAFREGSRLDKFATGIF